MKILGVAVAMPAVRRRRRPGVLWGAVLAVIVCMASIVSCGSDVGAVPNGPYKAQIQQARQEATSDFERRVLADGVITKAEYDEAVNRYVKCMADQGITVTPYDMGGGYYGYEAPVGGMSGPASGECAKGTTVLIEDLYVQMLTNPTGGDIYDAIAACLARKGLVDDSFTGAKLKELNAQDPEGGNLPFDFDAPDAQACRRNPAE